MEELQQPPELRRMKLWAGSLLVLALIIFVVTSLLERSYSWVGFIRAAAEAAMVGGIADWFAVTALFRHPLGLKIPHTAIVPRRKREIGQKLARFIRQNFLSEEAIADKLSSMDATRQIAGWLSQPENSTLIAEQMAAGGAAIVEVMKDEAVQSLIEQRLVAQIRSTQFAPLLGQVLGMLLAGKRQQELLAELVKLSSGFIKENRPVILDKIGDELPWWAVVAGVDRKIYQSIINSVNTTLYDVRANPKHELYQNFQTMLDRLIEDLKSSPDLLEKEHALKEELLQEPLVRDFSASLWADLKSSLVEQSSQPKFDLRPPVQQMLVQFGHAILNDPLLYAKIDGWLREVVLYVTKTYGYEVESLISNTIDKWDSAEITHKIESEVGRDLQFIRINGTLIGGLVGLVIYTVSFLIKQL